MVQVSCCIMLRCCNTCPRKDGNCKCSSHWQFCISSSARGLIYLHLNCWVVRGNWCLKEQSCLSGVNINLFHIWKQWLTYKEKFCTASSCKPFRSPENLEGQYSKTQLFAGAICILQDQDLPSRCLLKHIYCSRTQCCNSYDDISVYFDVASVPWS